MSKNSENATERVALVIDPSCSCQQNFLRVAFVTEFRAHLPFPIYRLTIDISFGSIIDAAPLSTFRGDALRLDAC